MWERRLRIVTSRLLSRVALCSLFSLAGCLGVTSEDHFIGSNKENLCSGVWYACKDQSAGCVLNQDQYLTGTFPGVRKFLVETPSGDWKIKIQLFLRDRLSPGTETEIDWYEPGCGDVYEYRLSRSKAPGDLFEQAGKDQIFEVQQAVVNPGDHLVTLWSDSICRYLLKVELVR